MLLSPAPGIATPPTMGRCVPAIVGSSSSLSSSSASTSTLSLATPRLAPPLMSCPYLFPASTPIKDLPHGLMTLSLGKHAEQHNIDVKIAAVKHANFSGIEVHMDDVVNEARRLFSLSSTPSPEELYAGARSVRAKCDAASLPIFCLEPFLHYPGLLPISRRDERLQEVPRWFTVADILGTDTIQVAGAMFGGAGVSTDEARIVSDLRILADMGFSWPRPKYWAYEAMCFGAHTTSWTQAWRHVELVDRPNFGMVVDTFQILGDVYADPTVEGGKKPNADAAVEETIEQLRATFSDPAKRAKVFFMQLGDAALMDPPLSTEHPLYDPKQHATLKMAWARTNRLFSGEGYMPSERIARTLLVDCGWRGWISAEYFNLDASTDDAGFAEEAAMRCRKGHEMVLASCE